ncbi:hypothetical protein EVJ58_g9348 [Rhodofomes roseus]|uniref:PIN domain-like protein n=1 Tax=Rhodofomes roseus TaxID=34475 RepID=A0A4Y9XV41_9APHY|nr:hypothetical protein EVJ58_g9348 [Rhodofomes roseus]
MGVHGLTTYLHERRTALAHTISFPKQHDHQPPKSTTIVIDGWSFIFELVSWAGLPYIYGGEYEAFSRLVVEVVVAWKSVGLDVCFVFDGAYPTPKFPTLVSRATQTTIQVGLLFFRTSAQARSTPRFLRENSLLPPLTYTVCVQTLLDLISSSAARDEPRWLEVHFADEEGDPYAVALAARLGAYVVGRDSDFVVLNAEGYQGYIPLDEMVWIAESTSAAASDAGSVLSSTDGDDDLDPSGFKTVRKPKARKREAESSLVGRGIIPPTTSDTALSLVCNVYSPASLATNLQIPVSLLPLLGALVGNDFTGSSDDAVPTASLARPSTRPRHMQYMFFERQLTHAQRIARVASTLRSLLGPVSAADSPAIQKRKRKRQISSVMELIDAAVNALLLRAPDTTAPGELEAVVERIVEATLQYAIPRADVVFADTTAGPLWQRPGVCPLHGSDACRLEGFLSPPRRPGASADDRSPDDEQPEQHYVRPNLDRSRVGELYMTAYRRGELSPPRAGRFEYRGSVAASRARGPRQGERIGLPGPPEEETEVDDDAVDSEDELVDVVEENSDEEDPLSPLRDALERLDHPSDIPNVKPPSSLTQQARPRSKVITEYVRRGTRLAPEEVTVPFFHDLLAEFTIAAPPSEHEPGTSLPIQLWPEELRHTFLLRALGADTPGIRNLHGGRLTAVLAVRWVVQRMHARALENPSQKEKQIERWTREEVRAFLAAFAWPFTGDVNGKSKATLPPSEEEETSESTSEPTPVPIEERNIQLVTQVSLAGDAIEQFAQLLLLGELAPNPMRYFSGLRFHTALTSPPSAQTREVDILNTTLEDLDEALTTKPTKVKKKRKGGDAVAPTPQKGQRRGPAQSGNMYDVLAAMGA